MKYLSDYTKDGIASALKFYGAFFAFSQDQFNAQKDPALTYTNGPHGLIVPKDNLDALMADLDRVSTTAIAQDITENGLHNIILRELNNYECFYTGDYEDALPSLLMYPGIDEAAIKEVFKNKTNPQYEPTNV
jgi:hypothetical protein